MAEKHSMRLERLPAGSPRDEVLPLLLLADDSEMQVRAYYQQGDLFVVRGEDGAVMAMVLAIESPAGDVELKSVAVAPALHRQGIGQRTIALVLDVLRAAGVRRVVVGTSSSGIGELAFYQKAGFRFWKIERDYFTPERGYHQALEENGIPLRDMVWMDRRI